MRHTKSSKEITVILGPTITLFSSDFSLDLIVLKTEICLIYMLMEIFSVSFFSVLDMLSQFPAH